MNTGERLAFGELLRRYRLAAGMTQEMLAERAGLSARGVQDLERGVRQTPNADTARRLAEALDLAESDRATLQSARQPADIQRAAAPGPLTGIVTFLFTDVEGSTRLWQHYRDRMGPALARHDELIEQLVEQHDGTLVRPRGEGDSRFAVFARASDAAAAACAIQIALIREPWALPEPLRVRIAIHTGESELRLGDYYGPSVNHCARLRATAHGGQVVVSTVTADLVREALAGKLTLRDLGEHRLKDLEWPEQIWQVVHPDLPAEFPPLMSVGPTHHNLPQQLSSFVGRERAITELCGLLASSRLLTLTGPGGIGKTRLASHIAAEVTLMYRDGVRLVELEALADPRLVLAAIAAALGVREQSGCPLLETLINALKVRELLLVLDNCEHLVSACAEITQRLLAFCPQLRILATSREPLRINGETVRGVSPLSVPDLATLATPSQVVESEAVRLFIERAKAISPGFGLTEANAQTIGFICRQLDGIPLAIELAAARANVLAVDQIAARIDDRLRLLTVGRRAAPARHHTLRATVDWSYELLSEPERRVFERLAVFAGGCSLEAAEAVCGGQGVEREQVVDLLTQVVNKSLLIAQSSADGEQRYRLLETLRKYAVDRLVALQQLEGVRKLHAQYYVQVAETANARLRNVREERSGRDERWGLNLLELEHDNLLAALNWALESGESELGLRIGGSLWRFWINRGHLTDAEHQLARLLPHAVTDSPASLQVTYGAGFLAMHSDRFAEGRALFEPLVERAEREGNWKVQAGALTQLAFILRHDGDIEKARSLGTLALQIRREHGDERGMANGYEGLALVAVAEGDHALALHLLDEAMEHGRAAGDTTGVAQCLRRAAMSHLAQGNLESASACLRESMLLYRDVWNPDRLALVVAGFGWLALADGQVERGFRLLGAAGGQIVQIGYTAPSRDPVNQNPRAVASARQAVGDAVADAALADGRAFTLDAAIQYALATCLQTRAETPSASRTP
jgi:predicted ATPase/class 3 adenylate cyclase